MTVSLEPSMIDVPPTLAEGARLISSIPHLTDAVETRLRASDDPLPRAARQRLALFVVGVLLAGTVVLRRVATTQTPTSRWAPPRRPVTNAACAAS